MDSCKEISRQNSINGTHWGWNVITETIKNIKLDASWWGQLKPSPPSFLFNRAFTGGFMRAEELIEDWYEVPEICAFRWLVGSSASQTKLGSNAQKVLLILRKSNSDSSSLNRVHPAPVAPKPCVNAAATEEHTRYGQHD